MRVSVRANVGMAIVSPASCGVPSALYQKRWLPGHFAKNSRWRFTPSAVLWRSGKPSRAYSMARAATVSKLIVPHVSSTVSAACSAPGTTAGSSPAPCSVLPRDRYQSTLTAFGAQPWPTIEVTFFSRTGYTSTRASPPRL